MESERPLCPHCGRRFGYLIDGKFHPVAWHGHKMPDGSVWVYAPGKPGKHLTPEEWAVWKRARH
jgi:hypothetical protein